MDDLIKRQDVMDSIEKLISARYGWKTDARDEIQGLNAAYCAIIDLPSAEPVIRCKDCKHKPHIEGEFESGFDIEFPDNNCPCQCEDGWYNWIPKDDWYCANAERKDQ